MAGYGATYASSNSNYDSFPTGCLPTGKGGSVFQQGHRRRMNIYPMIFSVIVPSALFSVVFYAMTSTLRFSQPAQAYTVVALGFLAVGALFACALTAQVRKQMGDPQREPNWFIFLFLTALLAWVLAMIGGEVNYHYNLRPYLNMQSLATYASVDTRITRGQQVMDAGVITFARGTTMNIQRSMSFRHEKLYCVVPITTGNTTQASYDFWAVGTDCCTAGVASFHCNTYTKKVTAPGGLRLLRDEERPYYRLAVQQAEATYGIKAGHPLFFEWQQDPVEEVSSWQNQAFSYFLMGTLSYLCIQVFFVACASLAFSKLGL